MVVLLLQHLVLEGGRHVVEGVWGCGDGVGVLAGHWEGEVRRVAWGDELAGDLLVEGKRVTGMLWMEVIVFAMLELGG